MSARGLQASSFLEKKTVFEAFLQSDFSPSYRERLSELKQRLKQEQGCSQRLTVKMSDLRGFDLGVAERFEERPLAYLAPWTDALHDWMHREGDGVFTRDCLSQDSGVAEKCRLGVSGNLGNIVSPRNLRSRHLGRLVCVAGTVIACSQSTPKLEEAIQWCPKTSNLIEYCHRDATALDLWMDYSTREQKEVAPILPHTCLIRKCTSRDSSGVCSELDVACRYHDHQLLTIQEPFDEAPQGQMPRSAFSCVRTCELKHATLNLCRVFL